MKYNVTAMIPMHIHLDGFDIEAESAKEAEEKFKEKLFSDYNPELCSAIEVATEDLAQNCFESMIVWIQG